MDFLSNLTSSKKPDEHPSSEENPTKHDKPSSTELLSSAKLVAEAAQAKSKNQEFDQPKAAGAAADLLGAASDYGKLEEDKGLGKYVNQAEEYLEKYSHSSTTTTKTTKPDGSSHSTTHTTTTEEAKHEGGAGDYVKMAEGFLNKQTGDSNAHDEKQGGHGHGESGSGVGDYMKMAGDFLKKD